MMTAVFIFVLGTAVGSFLNVLIDRLSQGESIMGRSHCDYCKHTLSSFDLIPLFSFASLKGKCRYCRKKLSYQYPFIEFLTGCLFVFSWQAVAPGPDLFGGVYVPLGELSTPGLYLALFSAFTVIFFADLKYRIIPDEMQIAFFVISLLIKIVAGATITTLGFAVAEGFLVMLPILLLHLLTRGKGMGFGDVKLALNIGFLLGIKGGLLSLYFGFVIGAVAGILLVLLKQKRLGSKIAFGPFLLLGVWIVFVFRESLYQLVMRFYGV